MDPRWPAAGRVSLRRAAPGKCTGLPATAPTRLTGKINGYTRSTRAEAPSEGGMELNENARIDTSQIDDQRGAGGGGGGIGGLPIGGGGPSGRILTMLIAGGGAAAVRRQHLAAAGVLADRRHQAAGLPQRPVRQLDPGLLDR